MDTDKQNQPKDSQDQSQENYDTYYVNYVIKQKNGQQYVYPLCEFHSRFSNTTSPDNIKQPQYFNTYIRSAKHRIRKNKQYKIHKISISPNQENYYKKKNIFFTQNVLKKEKGITPEQCNHLGLQNPYTRSQIIQHTKKNSTQEPTQESPKEITEPTQVLKQLDKQKPIIQKSNNLYLQYVGFLYKQCKQTIKKLKQSLKGKIKVYLWNQYPALMVYPQTPQMENKSQEEKMKKYYVQLFMCMFVAECLNLAKNEGIPIQIVVRSSFGHILPSVAEMGQSFRINVGLVPLCYIEKVLVVGLKNTINNFQNLMQVELSFKKQPFGADLKKYSQKLVQYKINYAKKKISEYQKKKSTTKDTKKSPPQQITENRKSQLLKLWENEWISMPKLLESKASGGIKKQQYGKCLIAEILRSYNTDYLIDLILIERIKNQLSNPQQKADYLIDLTLMERIKNQLSNPHAQSQKSIYPYNQQQSFMLVARAIFRMLFIIDQQKIKQGQFSFNNQQIKKQLKGFDRAIILKSKNIQIDQEFNTVASIMLFGLGKMQIQYIKMPQQSPSLPLKQQDDSSSLQPVKELPLISGQQLSNFYQNVQDAVKKMLINTRREEISDKVDKLSSHFSEKETNLRSFKVILTSGMGAILMAVLATSAQILKHTNTIKIVKIRNKENMYYESTHIEEVFDRLKIIGQNDKEKQLAPIVMFDLNYVKTRQEQIKLKKNMIKLQDFFTENVQYIILDVTTSSLQQISNSLQKIFLSKKLSNLRLVLTVSSGLKLQQLGQDLVQWGEIRIFERITQVIQNSKKAKEMQEFIYQLLQGEQQDKNSKSDLPQNIFKYLNIPLQVNAIRKTFKNAQMTLKIKGMDHFCKKLASLKKDYKQFINQSQANQSNIQFLHQKRIKHQ